MLAQRRQPHPAPRRLALSPGHPRSASSSLTGHEP